MIKKTLLYFGLLFALYFLFCKIYTPSYISSQGFWQDNQIKAQDYLYSNTDSIENIIVGTSMSFRLQDDSLKNFYNLGLLGQGYIDGLEVITKKGVYPKRVFIETNFATTLDKSGLFYEILYNPILEPLRKHLPPLRDGRQPFLIAGSALENLAVKQLIVPSERDKYAAIFKSFVEPSSTSGRYQDFGKPLKKEYKEKVVSELKAYVKLLEEHDTEIIFFEMPIHKALYNSPKLVSTREAFEEAFPSAQYIYLPRPTYNEYETLDGLHLSKKEAELYTLQFRAQIDSLINTRK